MTRGKQEKPISYFDTVHLRLYTSEDFDLMSLRQSVIHSLHWTSNVHLSSDYCYSLALKNEITLKEYTSSITCEIESQS